ncbi:YceD family protein [Granulicella cerasi]|uniref:YceD family protein n=1 Tax=Granulicella cerasi TaxID=741063 RepID=A0ABW1ZB14_9BACT|nr:DUF177 domain-containing protein [Granulicella cerasi]
MLITPELIADEPYFFDMAIAAGEIEYAPDVQQTGPLVVKGQADLLEEHRGGKEVVEDIRLRGKFEGPFELTCGRCLEPIDDTLSGKFDLIFRPGGVDAEAGEHAITEDETEIGYYEESGLRLEDAVREQVLLGLPGRILCREDCKGLCPSCGVNRNTTECNCSEAPSDQRWNALAGISLPPKA